jgi:hypothetical protein
LCLAYPGARNHVLRTSFFVDILTSFATIYMLAPSGYAGTIHLHPFIAMPTPIDFCQIIQAHLLSDFLMKEFGGTRKELRCVDDSAFKILYPAPRSVPGIRDVYEALFTRFKERGCVVERSAWNHPNESCFTVRGDKSPVCMFVSVFIVTEGNKQYLCGGCFVQ